MRREWGPEELIDCWTLVEGDWDLVANKAGATRLGFGLLLKYFELEGRFPRHAGELPRAAVDYVAAQVKVATAAFADYQWSGRTIEYHRAQVRKALGFREATLGDEDKLAVWLGDEVCPVELADERLREALVVRCRAERIEPPGASRIERIVGAARAAFEERFTALTVSRLPHASISRLEAVVADGEDGGFLVELKTDPGKLGIETLFAEVGRLERSKAVGLPPGLFADASEKLVEAWRSRAARLYPSDLRSSPAPIRLTLLAALCWLRTAEITDSLVDLLIALVHRIDARAENRVESEVEQLRRVRGKEGILFAMAQVAVERPDETVRAALYPVVGEATLKDLGRRGEGQRGAASPAGPDRSSVLVFGALSPDASRLARRSGVPLQQHRLPAGDGRLGLAQALHDAAGAKAPLRLGRTGASRWRGAPGMERRSGRRHRPSGAHSLRAVRVKGPPGGDPAAGGLCGWRQPLARPRRGPAS